MARPRKFDEQQVLDRALDTFWEKGYHATSYEDLVERMGINRASMYNTFGDKHQLYTLALQRYRENSKKRFEQWLRDDLPIQRIIQNILTEAVEESLTDRSRKGCLLVNTSTELGPHDPEIAAIIKENQEQVETILTELLTKAQRRGEIGSEHDPRALGRFYFNTFSGLRVMARANPDAKVFQDIVTVSLQVIS